MCFDIDLFAIDHSKVASYKNRSSGGLHALCAKALAKAYEDLDYVIIHENKRFDVLASRERLPRVRHPHCFLINRAFAFATNAL